MATQRRVTFWFGSDTDVRYLAELPVVGDFVSHDRGLWVVTSVESDAIGALVVCELPREEGL